MTNITIISLTILWLLIRLYRRSFFVTRNYRSSAFHKIVVLGIGYWAIGSNATAAALVMTRILNSWEMLVGIWYSICVTSIGAASGSGSVILQLVLWTKLGTSIGSDSIVKHVYQKQHAPITLLARRRIPWIAQRAMG